MPVFWWFISDLFLKVSSKASPSKQQTNDPSPGHRICIYKVLSGWFPQVWGHSVLCRDFLSSNEVIQLPLSFVKLYCIMC